MSRFERFKVKLSKKERALGTTISNVGWSGLVQKVASFPFDFVVFDVEHGTLSIESIEEALRVCRLTDLPSIVRVPDSIPNLISKTLDMGADGILVPRVESIEQVTTAVRAMRYFPKGRKGCGGFSNLRQDDNGSTEKYNENRLLFIQMESLEGLEILPAVLTKYSAEIAGVIIGPYDASIMLGTPLDITSDPMTKFIANVFSICKLHGLSCGSFVDDASMLERYRALGGNVFWTGTELSLLSEALGNLCATFSKLTENQRDVPV